VTITHGERARLVVPSAGTLIAQIEDGARHLLRSEPASLDQLKDARLFLETGLARLAAERGDEAGHRAPAARIGDQREALKRLDEFLARDMAFHREIAALTENPIFPALIEAMFGWLSAYYRSLVRAPGAEMLTIAEHEQIAGAHRGAGRGRGGSRHARPSHPGQRALSPRCPGSRMNTERRLALFGTDEPRPETVRLAAGPLSLNWVAGAVRGLAWNGVEIVRGIAFLVRDESWGTPPTILGPLEVAADPQGFQARWRGRTEVGGAALPSRHPSTARLGGRFRFAVEGAPDGDLRTNRAGFVVLHPAGFAGERVVIEHIDGGMEESRLPAAHQPGPALLRHPGAAQSPGRRPGGRLPDDGHPADRSRGPLRDGGSAQLVRCVLQDLRRARCCGPGLTR
jgi:hypothetical protein